MATKRKLKKNLLSLNHINYGYGQRGHMQSLFKELNSSTLKLNLITKLDIMEKKTILSM